PVYRDRRDRVAARARQPHRRRSRLRPGDDPYLGASAWRVAEGAGEFRSDGALMPAAAVRALLTLAVVVLIELACRFGLVNPHSLIAPTLMAVRLGQLVQQGSFWQEVALTARNILIALIAAVVVGFAAGTILHGLPRVRRAVEPMIASWYAL